MRIPMNMPKYNFFNEKMTKEDWDYYFKCRENNDIEISNEKLTELFKEAVRLIREEGGDASAEFCIKNKYPIPASVAKFYKDIYGFKFVQNYNLFLAKKEYPDDF